MNTQELPLVTFEQAKRLKQLGFDWETFEFYAENGNSNHWKNAKYDIPKNWNIMHDYKSYDVFYSAPTVALALKWMRDVKKIINWVECNSYHVYFGGYFVNRNFEQSKICKEYEASESALLDELLTILEKEMRYDKA